MVNLDVICANAAATARGDASREDTLNAIRKTHGVLVGQGLYAAVLFALAQNDGKNKIFKPGYDSAVRVLITALTAKEVGLITGIDADIIPRSKECGDILDMIINISKQLPKLQLAYKIADQTLTYARYNVEAMAGKSTEAGSITVEVDA